MIQKLKLLSLDLNFLFMSIIFLSTFQYRIISHMNIQHKYVFNLDKYKSTYPSAYLSLTSL